MKDLGQSPDVAIFVLPDVFVQVHRSSHDRSILQETAVPQPFLSQFPKQENRENIRLNREFFQENRE
jgi:hypothetical protein